MYQDMSNEEKEKLPIVYAKVKGNQVELLKKDEYIWDCRYEKILRKTVVFIPVEQADNDSDIKLFEKSTRMYLADKGCKVESTQYFPNSNILKEYLVQDRS